eukprot:1041241-Pelagomonas_calceolata.AAC.2
MYSEVACGLHCFVNSVPNYLKGSAQAKQAPPNVKRVTRGGVGLQPENLADRLLVPPNIVIQHKELKPESIDLRLEIGQDVKARQERNTISVWKLGK